MTKIGRYEIVAELGRGAMAVIYRAKDPTLDREVALKALSFDGAQDQELLERFCREARSCAKLRHPNIVTVYDFGKHDNTAYIAMELLEGSDLRQIIARGAFVPLAEKLQMMAGVCHGLAHAHSKGIVHRDVKTSNIFIDLDGQSRILDFGVAYVPASSLTVVGRALGTPQYMAPEQLEGLPCDARSDIFSAGIVIYEFLSSRHPFRRFPEKQGGAQEPPSLLELVPGCSREVEAALKRALAIDPKSRFSSAGELASVLTKASAKVREDSYSKNTVSSAGPVSNSAGTETILSAVLVNLQRFDDAAERGDSTAARSALAAMRQAGAEDSRYSVALEQSAKRLAEMESAQLPIDRAAPLHEVALPLAQPISLPKPGPIRCGTESGFATSSAPMRLNRPEPLPIPSEAPLSGSPRVPRKAFRISGGVILFVSLLGCGLLTGGLWFLHPNLAMPPRRLPAVAQASVIPVQAFLYTSPDSSHPPFAIVHQGDGLNVLRAPRFQEQEWIEVQQVSATHVTPVLFIRTTDLGNWSSPDPGLAAGLHNMFGSAGSR